MLKPHTDLADINATGSTTHRLRTRTSGHCRKCMCKSNHLKDGLCPRHFLETYGKFCKQIEQQDQSLPATGPGHCLHCRRKRKYRRRGLCCRCHRDPEIRAKYLPLRSPRGQRKTRVPSRCKHCPKVVLWLIRGLCQTCHKNPKIRAKYPPIVDSGRRGRSRAMVLVVATYHPEASGRCVHGLREELCARCEVAQRQAMGLMDTTEEDDE